jgi:hypothetical protein
VESGRLPPPKGWEDMPARPANAELTDPAAIAAEITPAIAETVEAETLFLVPGETPMLPVTVRVVARDPVRSKGPEAINRQLFKAAIARSGALALVEQNGLMKHASR